MPGVRNVVLVHGAFADGSSWGKVISYLSSRGLNSTAVQNPLSSLADDVGATMRAIDNQDGPVLLVGHSWGGAVITEAGTDPRVAGLVYVAAATPDAGQSFNDWWKDYGPSEGAGEIRPYGKDGYVALSRKGVDQGFAHDLSPAERNLFFATQSPTAARCFDDKVTKAAWRERRSWYVLAEKDKMVQPVLQRDSALKLKAGSLVVETSHAAILADPEQISDLIVEAASQVG